MRRRVRRAIRSLWSRLPLVMLLASLGALVFFGVRVVQVEKRAAREEASRNAEINSQYDECVRSIPMLRRINRFVRGVQHLHKTLYRNALATHEATPPGSDTYRAQVENLDRLKLAVADVSGIRFPVPTKKQCGEIRDARLRGAPGTPVGIKT